MPLIVTNVGEVYLLRRTLRPEPGDANPFILGLYTNAPTLHGGTVLADLVPANFPGYAPKELDPQNWSTPQLVVGIAQSQYGGAFQTWAALSGSQFITGYYVADYDANFLIWAEPFPLAVEAKPGALVSVFPYLRGRSEFNT